MRPPIELGEVPAQAVLDGAIGLALATGVPLRLQAPLTGADLLVALAAVKLGGDAAAVETAREQLAKPGAELLLPHPRAGLHLLDLQAPGAVARGLCALVWPLALLGKPGELRLRGPNHCDGAPTFHDLRLGWVPLAAQFGLKLSVDLTQTAFGADDGELVATLDPAPALTPLHLVHRGILRQVSIIAAVAGGRHEAALEAAEQAVRALRRQGVIAEAERVRLPVTQGRSRWALTARAEFEHSVVSVSELGPAAPAPGGGDAAAIGDRLAQRLEKFLPRRGAVDAATAERLLLPSFLCAAGLGARAGTPPSCHYTTSAVTSALLELATTARQALPVRAVVDGAEGEEGMIVVAPT